MSKTLGKFRHPQVEADGISFRVVEAGSSDKPTLLFLDGWPQSWRTFEPMMTALSQEAHVVAIYLPGIRGSKTPPRSNDKNALACHVHGLVERMKLPSVTLVGHDVVGQIVFAYLKAYPDALQKAVIMNVAVPSVDPWSEVMHNLYIWHSAIHAMRNLPELLVRGKAYFAFFFDTISAGPDGVSESAREMYVQACELMLWTT